jgi:hypothetical protein
MSLKQQSRERNENVREKINNIINISLKKGILKIFFNSTIILCQKRTIFGFESRLFSTIRQFSESLFPSLFFSNLFTDELSFK